MTEQELLTLKQAAAEQHGVPVNLINGDNADEITASAAALAAYGAEYKRNSYEAAPTREKFAAWLNGEIPAKPIQDTAPETPKYPSVKDGGEPVNFTVKRDTHDAFAEWFKDVTAYNPRKNDDIFLK